MRRNSTFILVAALLLVTLLLAYSNHFRNPFEFDDSHTIVNNAAIRDLRNIPRFFTDASTGSSAGAGSDYRPVLTTLNAIDYAIAGGLDPLYFHISIFVSYLVLGVLLYFFYLSIARMSGDRPWLNLLALLAAGWFMLLTANAETINYIIQRGDSFSTLMVVLGFVVYIYQPGWRKYGLYLIPMIVGFLTKTPALMFAPLLFFYDLLFERSPGLTRWVQESRWPQVLRSASVALPAFVLAGLLVLLHSLLSPAYGYLAGRPGFNYLITQPFVLVHYFDNFLLPLQLTADTDWKALSSPIDDRFFAGMAFIVLLLGIAAFAARRREGRPITFGILWFFIALAPTSSFIPLDEVLNDHRPFFAYIGLALAFSWAAGLAILKFEAFFTRSRLARAVLGGLVAVILLGNAWGAYQRNRIWNSGESLWYDAARKSPGSANALMNYGLTQMAKGKYDVALEYYHRALVVAPNYSYLEINLGIVNGALKLPAEAERHFQRAVQLAPQSAESYFYYARWLAEVGRITEARDQVSRALAIAPAHLPAQELAARLQSMGLHDQYIGESLTLYQAGDYQKSVQAAQRALEVKPESPIALNNLCAAYNGLRQWDQAIAACQKAISLQPDYPLAQNNLKAAQAAAGAGAGAAGAATPGAAAGTAAPAANHDALIADSLRYYQAGDYQASLQAAQQAAQVKPDSVIAYNNVCAAAIKLQQWDAAIAACQKALALEPDYQLAQNNLKAAQTGKASAYSLSTVNIGPPAASATPTPAPAAAAATHDALIAEGLRYYQAGDYQKSIASWQQALQVKPDSAIAYNNICAAYNQLKLWDLAIAACQKALALQPDFALAQNNLQAAQQGKR